MDHDTLASIKKYRRNYILYGTYLSYQEYKNICYNNIPLALSWKCAKHIKFVKDNCTIMPHDIDRMEISNMVYIRLIQVKYGSKEFIKSIASVEEKDTVLSRCYYYGDDEIKNIVFKKLKPNMKNIINSIIYCGTNKNHIAVAKMYRK